MTTAAQGKAASPRERAQEKKHSKGWLFNHPQDKHCAIYNLVVLACYGSAFWLWLHPETAHLTEWYDKLAFCLGAGYLLGWISGVNVGVNFHNHAHKPIFRKEWINRWFGRIWTFSGGWPAFYWYHSHVVVHHSNLLDGQADWTMPKRRPDGRFENIYKYVFLHWPWRYFPHLYRDFKNNRGGDWVRGKAIKEGLIFLALWSIPWFIDPVMAVGLWLFPAWIGNGVTMAAGMYVQHAGSVAKCEEFPVQHSNSFHSKFFNLTMFNIGYHIVHHDYEQVHWSVLPRFHDKMKERLIANGAHVVPYGYYHASHLVAKIGDDEGGFNRFAADQVPAYESSTGYVPTWSPAADLRRAEGSLIEESAVGSAQDDAAAADPSAKMNAVGEATAK
ncbi:MAG: fatty acid desaturase [Planctomycetota bacterium]|jgi:fatty acid desaturase